MNGTDIASSVVDKLSAEEDHLRRQFASTGPIHHFVIDDVLPVELAMRICQASPARSTMKTRHSLRGLKFIAAQMDQYDPLPEEAIYAFQDPCIVELVTRITSLRDFEPDEQLYAGSLSMMVKDHFLNLHLDNSHDKERQHYHVLNPLYYCSPDWSLQHGGNLELWPQGPEGRQVTVESRFNRLAVMLTHRQSWHSVSQVVAGQARCCVANYYFSRRSPEPEDYFHVTSFRGRPEQKVRDLVLRADVALHMAIRRLSRAGPTGSSTFTTRSSASPPGSTRPHGTCTAAISRCNS